MTAAELVAELKRHNNATDLGVRLAVLELTAELDARCEWLGLEINSFGDIILRCFVEHPRFSYASITATMVAIKNASEFSALLSYLLTKGGDK